MFGNCAVQLLMMKRLMMQTCGNAALPLAFFLSVEPRTSVFNSFRSTFRYVRGCAREIAMNLVGSLF